MAVSFKIPKQPRKSIDVIDTFLGADFTNSPAGADKNKSPGLKNMIRDVPGKIRKCMGYETLISFTGYDESLSTSYVFSSGSYDIAAPEYDCSINNHGMALEVYEECDIVLEDEDYFDDQSQMQTWYEAFGDTNVRDLLLAPQGRLPMTIDYVKFVKIQDKYYLMLHAQAGARTTGLTWKFYTDPDDYTEENEIKRPINGFYKLRYEDVGLIHAGTNIYKNGELLYDNANDHRSMAWEFDEHLYIVDGKRFLRYGLNIPKSNTVYKEDVTNNKIVVGESVSLVVKEFSKKQHTLEITVQNTTSPNGKFYVNKSKTRIIYTDLLTEVGQNVTYSCTYKYKQKSTSSVTTTSTATHHLIGISDRGTEYEVIPVEDVAYVPLFTYAKSPDGGGESQWDLNLLTPGFTEWFLPEQKYDSHGQKIVGVWQDDYYMSFDELDEVEPIVKLRNLDTGEWVEQTLGTDYTVDYSLGMIHFTTAPSLPIDETGAVLQAEDTVSITVYKTFPGYSDRINKCTIGTLFGVGGANDRLFLSGNPDYPNYDWYSGAYILDEDDKDSRQAREDFATPNYFPDTGYSTLGSSASAIVGYSRVSNYLAAHKDKYERDQHIIIREGDMVDSAPTFRIINTLQGAAAVAPYSFGYLATEPLFLTEQGIYAVTAQDITGEKYAQNRSFYLDGKLLEEENLEDAYGFVYNDMYWLCLNNVAYILDGLQPMRSDKAEPYATRQYAGFYRTNIPANVMWEEDGRLFFGTKDGKVKRFYKDKYALESYNDDGEPIEAIWETGDLTGNVFFKNKTLHHIAVKLDSAIAASVSIYVMWRGLWNFVRTDHWRARQFRFSTEEFQYHTFSNDKTQRVVPKKVRFKNVDKFRLRLTNNELNESFALSDVGIEFTETDNYTR